MELNRKELIEKLAYKVKESYRKSGKQFEEECWRIVHEHHHGLMPSEYDIREIDEDLYLALLERVKELN